LDKDNFIESVVNEKYESFGKVRKIFSQELYNFKSLQLNTKPITNGLQLLYEFVYSSICCRDESSNIEGDNARAIPAPSVATGTFMDRVLKKVGRGQEYDLENPNSVDGKPKLLDCSLEKLTTVTEKV